MGIHCQRHDELWCIHISRSECRNAIDAAHAHALYNAVIDFERSDAKVAILYGEGGHFCAGADLKAFALGAANPLHESGDLGPMGPTRLVLSKPIIAAIEGYCVAGGLELAAWCDLRVGAQDACFGVFCRRHGVPLIDGGTHRLPRLIGHSRAMDLILTGRELSAEEAYDWGFLNRLTPSGEAYQAAVALAHELCRFPQAALRADRLSAIEQWGCSETEALRTEFGRGRTALAEALEGAKRFSSS